MYWNGANKKGGWNKIGVVEERWICFYYKQYGSIKRTAKELGYSSHVVERAVKNISSCSKKSRNNNLKVLQIDLITKEIINVFQNAHKASLALNLNYSSLNQCINGKTNNCGGYAWCLQKDFNKFELPTNYKIENYSSKKIDELLGVRIK